MSNDAEQLNLKEKEVYKCTTTNGHGNELGNQDEQKSESPEAEGVAEEKLGVGKKSLACGEYSQAVDLLGEACHILAAKFGDNSPQLADPYFYYGKALLELARTENTVLGNALDGVGAEEENEADLSESDQFEKTNGVSDSERDDVRGQVYSAMSATEKGDNSEKTEGDKSEKDEDKTEADALPDSVSNQGEDTEKTSADNTDSGATEGSEAAASGETPADNANSEEAATANGEEDMVADEGEEDGTEDDGEATNSSQEDADDVPNLQLAWEILDLCKIIYLKMIENAELPDQGVNEKLSEVYRALGEVKLEDSDYEQAIEDLLSCLQIQKECFTEDNRYLAETYFQLGNCYLLDGNYEAAMENMNNAKSILELRVSNFEKKFTEEISEEESEKFNKELKQLRQLLPDIVSKIEDVADESVNAKKAETEVKAVIASQKQNGTTTIGFGETSDSSSAATIATKKANDISNLVRKRKPEVQPAEGSKKVKLESTPTAEGDKENGVSSTEECSKISS